MQERLYWIKTLDQYRQKETGILVSADSLADFLVSKQIVDISSLLPLALAERSWICGIQNISVTLTSRGLRTMLDVIDFGPAPTALFPRLSPKDVKERAKAQLRQRRLVIKVLNLHDRDSYEMTTWLNESPAEPWMNSYDVSGIPDSYNTQYDFMVHQVLYAKSVLTAKLKIDKQLAFPAKTYRWTSAELPLTMNPAREWSYEIYQNKLDASINKPYFTELSDYEEPFEYPLTSEERRDREELDQSMEDLEVTEDNLSSIISEYPVNDIYSCNMSHSTMIDTQTDKEEYISATMIKKLVENPDLRDQHYEAICASFEQHGIDFRTFLLNLFKIKKHDLGWLLNRITGFHNKHVDDLKYLNTDHKQMIAQFLIDIVDLYSGLHVRHVDTQPPTQGCASVNDVCDIIRSKIKDDNAAMNSLKTAKWIELNRATASNKMRKLINLLDVLTITNGFAAHQTQMTGEMVMSIMKEIVSDKPLPAFFPHSIMNFISSYSMIQGTGVSIIQNKALHVVDEKTKKRADPFDFTTGSKVLRIGFQSDTSKRQFKTATDHLVEAGKMPTAKNTADSSGSSGVHVKLAFSPIKASPNDKEAHTKKRKTEQQENENSGHKS